MIELSTLSIIIPLIVEVIKITDKVPKQYIPLTSILVGVVITVIFSFTVDDISIAQAVLIGILNGLTATGLYENVKNFDVIEQKS